MERRRRHPRSSSERGVWTGVLVCSILAAFGVVIIRLGRDRALLVHVVADLVGWLALGWGGLWAVGLTGMWAFTEMLRRSPRGARSVLRQLVALFPLALVALECVVWWCLLH